MSTTAKDLFERANAAGKTQPPYLQLGIKQEGGGSKSTGKHICTFVSDKEGDGKDPITGKPRRELQMVVSENGVKKFWNRPIMSKDGQTLDYLIAKIAELNPGDLFSVEMKSVGMKSFIELIKLGEGKGDIPTVQLDEDDDGTGDLPELGGEANIHPEEVPF